MKRSSRPIAYESNADTRGKRAKNETQAFPASETLSQEAFALLIDIDGLLCGVDEPEAWKGKRPLPDEFLETEYILCQLEECEDLWPDLTTPKIVRLLRSFGLRQVSYRGVLGYRVVEVDAAVDRFAPPIQIRPTR